MIKPHYNFNRYFLQIPLPHDYLLTYLLTYILTYSLHGEEYFMRS